jgi:allophanate hydrolase subunit 2
MSPALAVLAPGLLTTIQDLGRPGHQRLGVPVSGALDPVSLRAANALAGNVPDAGALEVAYVGPTLEIDADDVRLAFVGAEATIEILPDAAAMSGRPVEAMRSVRLQRGEAVRIGSLAGGAVLYIAVEGGFDIPPVLGSVSTYIRGGFGGFKGRALVAGDRLPLRQQSERP